MFLRPVEMFGRLEYLSWGRIRLSLRQLRRHQGRASHAHRRTFRIVIAHGLFRFRPEPVEFRFLADDLGLTRNGKTGEEGHRTEL